jgi:hypothetical protein
MRTDFVVSGAAFGLLRSLSALQLLGIKQRFRAEYGLPCTGRALAILQMSAYEGAQPMRIHPTQINPNAQLYAFYAAERAAAKREAERTRKKLSEFASKLTGELDSGEACKVRLGGEESQGRAKKQNQQRQANGTQQEEQAAPEDADNSISDWA